MIKKYLSYIKESNDFSKIGNYCIFVSNKEDYEQLMTKLEKQGFLWISNRLPTNVNYNHTKEVIFVKNGKLSHSDFDNYIRSKYSDGILYNINGAIIKMKKIKNIDIDPYGEEDWGYEEIHQQND